MASVEGKTPAERNKMIAAIALGAIAIISLGYMFLGSSSSNPSGNRNPNANANKPVVKVSPPPRGSDITSSTELPEDQLQPLPGIEAAYYSMPEAERNIFAFYVPPPPTPTPVITPKTIPTPTPIPPNVILSSISPVNVYAHTGDFNLDVTGDKFTPETRVYVQGGQLQTRFISPQQLAAKVPAQLISFEGAREIKVQSPDGKLFSNTASLNVMPAPQPNYTLIGVFNRASSNDVAILKDNRGGKDLLYVQRGQLIEERFRVTSISVNEVKLVDVTLKIPYTLKFVGDNSNPSTGRPMTPVPPPPSDDNGDGEP